MSRLFWIAVAISALCQPITFARAGEWACGLHACAPGEAFPPYHYRTYKFRPHIWDGAPLVKDFPDFNFYDAFHGTACVWSWQKLLPTPSGPAWVLVPSCASY